MQHDLSHAHLLKNAAPADSLSAATTSLLILLSLRHTFFFFSASVSSSTPAPHGGIEKQNPRTDLVESLTELTEQRALTEAVKTCQSFLHSPRRHCQGALLLLRADQTASPPSLCHMLQTTSIQYNFLTATIHVRKARDMKCFDRCGWYQVASGPCSGKHNRHNSHDDGTPLCVTLINRIGLHFRPQKYNHFPLCETE